MAKKNNDIPKDNNIIRVPLEEAMPDNYLPYAVEVAKDRALPDVRDGLKPVHRRILYGAYMLKAFPDRPYYKSARIVGDILGKYHPHGDSSVYDAMVILAQNFTTRAPLIDGHGNWGSIDGDSAAAMRYTEARLTPIALEMIRNIDKDIVNMVPNYSDSEMEPEVLPSRYPNILVNGAFGIAVGLATNIPPHNLREVINALLAYIDNNDITTSELMEYIKGPDLPTGGILIGKNSLLSAYEKGEGRVTLRAKAKIEKLDTGRLGIVITEFPYRKNKSKLLQTISDMTADKKHAKALEPITDIRDESDRNGIRAVIELRKSVDYDVADKVLKYLYKKTDLQSNLNFNMVALANGKPETLGLKSILKYYLEHQKEVITRRTRKELENAEKRFHIVEGFLKAIGIMDEIIKCIRESKSKKDAQINLVNKFGFSDLQAEAILELMLYRLTGLEITTFEKEYKELQKTINRLKNILSNEKELLKVIKKEIIEVRDKFGDDRRTEIIEDDDEAKIDVDELVVVEDVMVTMSNEGYIKRTPLKSYNRSNTSTDDIEYREGDFNKFLLQSNTKESLLLFTNKGNMYRLKTVDIPEYKWKEKGERIEDILKILKLDVEKVISVYSVDSFPKEKSVFFFTSLGMAKVTSLDKFESSYTKLSALKLRNTEELIYIDILDENNKKPECIECSTQAGMNFKIKVPVLEDADRAVLGNQVISMDEKNKITNIDIVEDIQEKNFDVGVNADGEICILKDNRIKNICRVKTSSSEELLIFNNNGLAVKIPAFMLQDLEEKIDLSSISDFDREKDKVVGIVSLKHQDENSYVYFFSKNGMIKKTIASEFKGDYSSTTAYKIKDTQDELITVDMGIDEEAIIITKRGMSIKFSTEDVNATGKVTSGVIGISLKEDDSVISAALIKEGNSSVTLKSKRGETETVDINDIKLQNRAGKGSNIMLVVLGDEVKDVKIV
ncbi:DNA topoisomerase IV subunit A [Clostridium oryzae]|uniref:DNA topoisomerase (ATP-hydrolyzing) n=1 Tax=Clostridium oryzae TaxID=1450648 RepID=A0A1V4ILV6_9CLOT|nr:DNA topoisomerase IV subunit A [Clostridium oryzae]OPJ60849.1 DNA gyrase subunit A [Clostridium oryzae]